MKKFQEGRKSKTNQRCSLCFVPFFYNATNFVVISTFTLLSFILLIHLEEGKIDLAVDAFSVRPIHGHFILTSRNHLNIYESKKERRRKIVECAAWTGLHNNDIGNSDDYHDATVMQTEQSWDDNTFTNYNEVISALDQLYPPTELNGRISTSRSDGYWCYLENGIDPPMHLTYGEFDFAFFVQLLEKAHQYHVQYLEKHRDEEVATTTAAITTTTTSREKLWQNKTFLDIGSGTGRLVIGTAALYPTMKLCKGIEILPSLHESALSYLDKCEITRNNNGNDEELGEEPSYYDKKDDLQQQQQDAIDIDDQDDNEEEEEENIEPLSKGMNDMIGALQEMSAEEWKQILGDCGIDESDLENFDEHHNDHNGEEYRSIDIKNKHEISTETSSESEIGSLNDDLDDMINECFQEKSIDDKERIEHLRSMTEMIHPDFNLPPESDLLDGIIDEENNRGNDTATSHYFESLDDFLNAPQEQLVNVFRDADLYSNKQDVLDEHNRHNDTNCDTSFTSMTKEYALFDEIQNNKIQTAPIEFSCGSFEDPYEHIADADVIFVFSTCWKKEMMTSLGECINRQCKPGTIIITTEYQLPLSGYVEEIENDAGIPFGEYKIKLLDTIDGECHVTGGISTAYIHQITQSPYEKGIWPRQKPIIASDLAWKIIQDFESKNLTDTEKFVRDANNALAFHGIDLSNYPNDDPS